tara:strand:- start:7864 stop:8043 length:180 start_codon:yes stop_codon:yes gene_type:complete
MSKQQTNNVNNPMSPYSPKSRPVGSVVTNQSTGKGGFESGGATSTSNMYGILSGNFEKK